MFHFAPFLDILICTVHLYRRHTLYVIICAERLKRYSVCLFNSQKVMTLLCVNLKIGVLPFGLELLAPFITLCTVRRHYDREHYNIHVQYLCVCSVCACLKGCVYIFSAYLLSVFILRCMLCYIFISWPELLAS